MAADLPVLHLMAFVLIRKLPGKKNLVPGQEVGEEDADDDDHDHVDGEVALRLTPSLIVVVLQISPWLFGHKQMAEKKRRGRERETNRIKWKTRRATIFSPSFQKGRFSIHNIHSLCSFFWNKIKRLKQKKRLPQHQEWWGKKCLSRWSLCLCVSCVYPLGREGNVRMKNYLV